MPAALGVNIAVCAGAAVVAVFVDGAQMWVGTAGDSRCAAQRTLGELGRCVAGCASKGQMHAIQISTDCKPEAEEGRIVRAGGIIVHESGICNYG